MRTTLIVARRELGGYFATPVASVFIVIFLVLQGALTFNLGNFFGRGLADLNPFFTFIPWVFLLLVSVGAGGVIGCLSVMAILHAKELIVWETRHRSS